MELFIVTAETCVEGMTSTTQRHFCTEANARKAFEEEVVKAKAELKEDGSICEILNDDTATEEERDLDRPVYLFHEGANYFECWLAGSWTEEHVSVCFGIAETED